MNQTNQLNIKTLRIIFFAFIAGLLMFSLVSTVVVNNQVIPQLTEDLKAIFLIIIAIMSVSNIFIGKIIFNKRIEQAKTKLDFNEKLNIYMSANIIRFALIEGVALFSIICFMLMGDWIFLAVTAVLIVFFITLQPTIERCAMDLELTLDERELLEK